MSEKPVLYYLPSSAPCRAVLLTAAALGIDLDLRLMNLLGNDHKTPEYLKLNPQHTVPLLNDNGTIIADSHIICGYLVDKYAPDDPLYPKDAAKRRQIEALLYFDCGNLFARVVVMLQPILYHGATDIPQDLKLHMERAYEALESVLTANSPYLCGAHLTIADLCTIATISSSTLFVPAAEQTYPKINAWMQKCKELAFYEQHNQTGVDMLQQRVEAAIVANKQN